MTHIESTSGSARIDDNLQMSKMFSAHPLGIGLGGSLENGNPLFSASDYYLSTSVELGFVGATLMLLMAIAFFRRNYSRYCSESGPRSRGIISGTVGSYVAMAVTLVTFPSLLHYPIPAFLAILGGVVRVIGRQPVDSSKPVDQEGRSPASQRRVELHR
jgi:hypothetical protein